MWDLRHYLEERPQVLNRSLNICHFDLPVSKILADHNSMEDFVQFCITHVPYSIKNLTNVNKCSGAYYAFFKAFLHHTDYTMYLFNSRVLLTKSELML